MKLLHVINSLSGSGGAEQGLVRESVRLGDQFDQLIVTLYPGGTLEKEVDRIGIPRSDLGLNSSQSGWNWLIGVPRLRRIIKRFQPDVVHSSLFSANLAAQLATRGTMLPVLSTFTLSGDVGLMRAYQPGAASVPAAILRRIARGAASRPNVWFRAITRDALDTNCLALGVDSRRAVLIPRGVPLSEPDHPLPDRAELGLPSGAPLVLNVGRQTAQKGHNYLVEAFARVNDSLPSHLVIIGREGDGTSQLLRGIGELGLRDAVTIIPSTDRVFDYYAQATVFCFPSVMEGLGTAVLEAMASKLPVVAFDIPPIREITDHGRVATLVPVGNVEELSRALTSAIEADPDVERKARDAHTWVVERFSLDAVVEQLEHRLTQLAESGR